jgi:hypothetical protein
MLMGEKVKSYVFGILHLEELCSKMSMIGGSLVSTAWHVQRLRMEEKPSTFGGLLRIYRVFHDFRA